MANTFCQVAVAADNEGVVVADVGSEACPEVSFGDGHSDAVGDALTQWARSDLDAGGMPDLRMAWCGRAPLTEIAKVVERQPVTSQVQH